MSENKFETSQKNNNEIIISEETISKSITELEQEEITLVQAVKELTKALNEAKSENPTDFLLFKSINGKLRGNQKLLEEIRVALQIKKESSQHNDIEDFENALNRTSDGLTNLRHNAQRRASGL